MLTSPPSDSARAGVLTTPRAIHRPILAILVSCLLAGCHDRGEPVPAAAVAPPSFLVDPKISPNSHPTVPLAATISLETDTATQVRLSFSDGISQWTELAERKFRTFHGQVPVLGMRPGRTHEIRVTVLDQHGNETAAPQPLFFTTPALPTQFPTVFLTARDPDAMEPGVTFFSPSTTSRPPTSYLVAIDDAAEVVWYLDGSKDPLIANRFLWMTHLPNGNLLVLAENRIVEMDLLGDIKQIWHPSRHRGQPPEGATLVDVDSFHHDVLALPEGEDADFLVLSTELREFSNYPASETDPSQVNPTAQVVGDRIVEFKRDGTIVRSLDLLDVLDPRRLSYNSLGNHWNGVYDLPDTEDWSHSNAVLFDESDDTYIVSVRHQDVVVKIGRKTKELIWILGDPDRWVSPWADKLLIPAPGTPFEWNYHQHAPELTADGTLLMFDNGNNRAIPPLPPLPRDASYSRAVEYRIDPVRGMVEQVWAYGGLFDSANSFYSHFVSDANRLPITGNVLITDGGKMTEVGGHIYARLVEVTHEVPPRVVFEALVAAEESYFVYRAERLPSLYPPF